MLRSIYTFDFRAHFRNNLVHFREQKITVCLVVNQQVNVKSDLRVNEPLVSKFVYAFYLLAPISTHGYIFFKGFCLGIVQR